MSTGGPTGQQLPVNPLGLALGVQFEPFPRSLLATPNAPATQAVYAVALYATAGATVTGVKIANGTAAAGTLPTLARFGVADATGKMLAVSANTTALASWGAGVLPFPFTPGPLTMPASGLYFACFVVNGTWGTTQPQPGEVQTPSATLNAMMSADGTSPPPMFLWGGQTDLPAVGQSLTVAGGTSSRAYWIALY